MMKFRLPVGSGLLSAAAGIAILMAGAGVGTAGAQKLPTATAPGASITLGGTYSEFEAKYPQLRVGGAGGYIDLNIRRSFGLEGEGRWLQQGEISGSRQTTLLIGPRYEAHLWRLSAYLKGLIGNGNLKFPYGYGYGNYLVAAGGVGLDFNVSDNVKVRVFDVEYQDWPKFSLGTISPYGVSAGVSYRLYHTGGWRRHHYK